MPRTRSEDTEAERNLISQGQFRKSDDVKIGMNLRVISFHHQVQEVIHKQLLQQSELQTSQSRYKFSSALTHEKLKFKKKGS